MGRSRQASPAAIAKKLDAAMLAIAKEHLGVERLTDEKSDRSDFVEIHVAGLARALRAAYEAGKVDGIQLVMGKL